MTAVAERTAREPGVYEDVPAEDYLRDPALSSSGARRLLPPSCPAAYRWYADNPQPPKLAFDLGHAAHRELLGAGPDLAIVDADDWRTKAAQEDKKAAYAAGKTPLLRHEHDDVLEMVAAVRRHPVAGRLFQPDRGRSEVSVWWVDEETGVPCRCRYDYLPDPDGDGPFLFTDYKTAGGENGSGPVAAGKSMGSYGYHQQLDWYTDGALAAGLTGGRPIVPLLVFQERTAPYLVTTYQVREADLHRGAVRNRKARHVYAECADAEEWPDHGRGEVQWLELPRWAEFEHDAAELRGDYDIKGIPS